MSSRPTLDPAVWAVDNLSRWAWQQLATLAGKGLERTIFAPLPFPQAVVALYHLSRDTALASVGLVMVVVVIGSMWPEFALPIPHHPLSQSLERLVTAALIALAGLWIVRILVGLNNRAVATLIQNAGELQAGAAPTGVLSPLVVLLVAIALIVLMLYLAVFYAARMIEIYVLVAAIPWFALVWAARRDDAPLSTLSRELVVVVFVQTVHAGAFWLAFEMMGSHALGASNVFLELALFWYMTKIPAQFRRLAGAGLGVSRLWR